MRYIGHRYIPLNLECRALSSICHQLAHLSQRKSIQLYWETRSDCVERLPLNETLEGAQLRHGDTIVCAEIQRNHALPYKSVSDWYAVNNSQISLSFADYTSPKSNSFTLTVTRNCTYYQMKSLLSKKLGCAAERVRLFQRKVSPFGPMREIHEGKIRKDATLQQIFTLNSLSPRDLSSSSAKSPKVLFNFILYYHCLSSP